MRYLPSRKAANVLGVHPNTLRRWADDGKIEHIRTESGQRRYDVDSYVGRQSQAAGVCYCRVSSYKQKDDLERQVAYMQENIRFVVSDETESRGIIEALGNLKKEVERCQTGDRQTSGTDSGA